MLDRRRRMEVGQTDYLVVQYGDHDTVAHDDEALESGSDRRGLRLVAQLAEQTGDRGPVGCARVPNRQIHAE